MNNKKIKTIQMKFSMTALKMKVMIPWMKTK